MSDTAVLCPTCGEVLTYYGQEAMGNGVLVFVWYCMYQHWWHQNQAGWQPTEPMPEIAI